MKYLLTLSYCGKNYSGWQVQSNAPTVQAAVCAAAQTLFGCDCAVSGCSRTDAGVHAVRYYATVDVPLPTNIPTDAIAVAMCDLLPEDISVMSARTCDESFNARYDAVKKTYEYHIYNSEQRNPFLSGLAWHYRRPLDEKLMDCAAKHFIGEKDFSAFCASGTKVKSKVRCIYSSGVIREGDTVIFRISGNGFLYNMVRIITGTLVSISEGKTDIDDIDRIIESRDRLLAGATAPPDGLYLCEVEYS